MILLEKNILSSKEADELLTKSGSAKSKYLAAKAKEKFENDPDFPVYSEVLVDSMEHYGTDTAQNRFLQYIVTKNGTPFNMKRGQPYLIYNILNNAEANVTTGAVAKSSWLYNPNSYNGSDLKLKALAFLSSKDAARYGDPKTKPTQKILNTTDDAEIETILSNWQTKDGEFEVRASRGRTSRKDELRNKYFSSDTKKVAEDKAQKLELIKDAYSSSTAEIVDAINKVYTPGIKDVDLLAGVSKILGQNATVVK